MRLHLLEHRCSRSASTVAVAEQEQGVASDLEILIVLGALLELAKIGLRIVARVVEVLAFPAKGAVQLNGGDVTCRPESCA